MQKHKTPFYENETAFQQIESPKDFLQSPFYENRTAEYCNAFKR